MKSSIFLSLFLFLLISSSASAQGIIDVNTDGVVISSVTSTLGAVGLGVLTGQNYAKRQARDVSAFLRDNGTRFRSELALGSGEVTHDFAKLMAIPDKDVALFEKKLRENRKYISSFCDSKTISPHRTRELVAWVDLHYPTI